MPQTPKKRHGTICQMIAGVVAFRRNRTKTTLTFFYPSAGADIGRVRYTSKNRRFFFGPPPWASAAIGASVYEQDRNHPHYIATLDQSAYRFLRHHLVL